MTHARNKSSTKLAASSRFRVDLSQADFEIEFFGRVLQRHPTYVDVLRRQAELLARKGEFEQSLELDRRLVELEPENCIVRYNLACSLARLGKTQESLVELKQAIQLGYDDYSHLESDPDLANLHGQPAFQALLRRKRARK